MRQSHCCKISLTAVLVIFVLCIKGIIDFVLSTTTPCFVTFYWEVGKDAIDAVICDLGTRQLRSNFDASENNSSDSDSEEMASMSALPLEHVLQGSYTEQSFSELYPIYDT